MATTQKDPQAAVTRVNKLCADSGVTYNIGYAYGGCGLESNGGSTDALRCGHTSRATLLGKLDAIEPVLEGVLRTGGVK